jgi:hypothetical protein
MRIFGPIVEAFVPSMLDTRHHLALGGAVGAGCVGLGRRAGMT